MSVPRLAIVCDLKEENWPSMDLFAEMLCGALQTGHATAVRAERVCPPLRRRLTRLPLLRRSRAAGLADRLLNRYHDCARHLRGRAGAFDLFYVCDHSYAHLVDVVPAARTGVFCHDLDAFRCLLEPEREWQPRWLRALLRRTLGGLQKAAVVFYTTAVVRGQIERHGILDPSRLVQAPPGLAPEFTPAPVEPEPAADPLGRLGGAPYLLHVGSCIPRKRVDVLIDVFAEVRRRRPELRLLQVGGTWERGQPEQLRRRGVEAAVVQVRGLGRAALASLYRRARLVLVPSAAEGFGLPVIEALACGAPVVASDLPVLREVGGEAATWCPVGDVPRWAETVHRLLDTPSAAPGLDRRLARARRYSWAEHARIILEAYQRLR
jgi:glycosyltransferase involved in cell wall biosynthesis